MGRNERNSQSHEIALAPRGPLQAIDDGFGANIKLVEVPLRSSHRSWPGFTARPAAAAAKPHWHSRIGATFPLDDPIFSELAVSLIFGILVSTLLTLVVIPVLYYTYYYRRAADPG